MDDPQGHFASACRPRGSQRPAVLGRVGCALGGGALPSLGLGFPEPWGGQPVNRGVKGGWCGGGSRVRSPPWD